MQVVLCFSLQRLSLPSKPGSPSCVRTVLESSQRSCKTAVVLFGVDPLHFGIIAASVVPISSGPQVYASQLCGVISSDNSHLPLHGVVLQMKLGCLAGLGACVGS